MSCPWPTIASPFIIALRARTASGVALILGSLPAPMVDPANVHFYSAAKLQRVLVWSRHAQSPGESRARESDTRSVAHLLPKRARNGRIRADQGP